MHGSFVSFVSARASDAADSVNCITRVDSCTHFDHLTKPPTQPIIMAAYNPSLTVTIGRVNVIRSLLLHHYHILHQCDRHTTVF